MSFSLPPALNLPEDVHECLTRYIEQIQQSWSADLMGLILFGSAARGDFIVGRSNINLLLVIKKISVDLMQRAGQLHKQWGKHQIIAPLLMTEEDLTRSQKFFPLEYLQIEQSHMLLAGHDPFTEGQINATQLAWQCEQELMANLLRLRQRFIEGEGRNEAIQALLLLSISSVMPAIRGFLHILGHQTKENDTKTLEMLPGTLEFDPTVFLEILNMKKGLRSPGKYEWLKAFERYLQTLELFMRRVQEIRQEGCLGK